MAVERSTSRPRKEFGSLPSDAYIPRALPQILRTGDLTAVFLIMICFLTNATNIIAGGPAAFTYLLLGGLTFLVPSLIATAQLGAMFPHEGALYNWTHKVLGGFWSFFTGFCAWLAGILTILGGPSLLIVYLQVLHSTWLVPVWQQGLFIVAMLVLSAIMATQRHQTMQYVVNGVFGLFLLAVGLLTLAGVVWLVEGHHPATNLSHVSDWRITFGNIPLFGAALYTYIGGEVPIILAGEVKTRHAITRHLLWAGLIMAASYFLATFALLVVQGTSAAGDPFALVMTVKIALGSLPAKIVAVCIMSFFVVNPVVYNYVFARLLLVGSIDGYLPRRVGLLNRNRVPANAILFQTLFVALLALLIFVLVPYLGLFGSPADFALKGYITSQAAGTLVWTISTLFLFVNLFAYFLRNRAGFRQYCIFPVPILLGSILLGAASSLLGIVETLIYSWIPQEISNANWLVIVGVLTFICVVAAAGGGIFANSEAVWQRDQVTSRP